MAATIAYLVMIFGARPLARLEGIDVEHCKTDFASHFFKGYFDFTVAMLFWGLLGLMLAVLTRSSAIGIGIGIGIGFLLVVESLITIVAANAAKYLPGGRTRPMGVRPRAEPRLLACDRGGYALGDGSGHESLPCDRRPHDDSPEEPDIPDWPPAGPPEGGWWHLPPFPTLGEVEQTAAKVRAGELTEDDGRQWAEERLAAVPELDHEPDVQILCGAHRAARLPRLTKPLVTFAHAGPGQSSSVPRFRDGSHPPDDLTIRPRPRRVRAGRSGRGC